MNNFLRLTSKITHRYLLCIILSTSLLLILKKAEKHAFFLKNGLTTCYLWRHIS